MERDFMGLSSKDPLVEVKEEVAEPSEDSGSGVPWPSSSRVSALPHFMSFKTAQDDKPLKLVSDHFYPPEFVAMSLADGCDLSNKHQPAEHQQATQSAHLPHDIKILPNITGIPFCKAHLTSGGQNFVSPALKQQIFGGIPLANQHSVLPSIGFVAGMTEPRCNSKVSSTPAQLTIFYAGAVQVYDDISAEKAQAIMFLARNRCTVSPPKVLVQAPASIPPARDDAFIRKIINTQPCSARSSPISVSSHPVGQTIRTLIEKEEGKVSKTIGISTASISKADTPKKATSAGSVVATTIMPLAVPQARKASLARFLEKRKERVLSSSPYQLDIKPADGTTPESKYAGFSATSGVGCSSMPARE